MTTALIPATPSVRWPPEAFTSRGLLVDGDPHCFAVFSQDRRYRYVLGRMKEDYFDEGAWADASSPLLVAGMCNPSSAGAYVEDGGLFGPAKEANDPTVTKLLGFRDRLGCGGLLVVNRGAYIATDPRDFARAADPIGEHNEFAIGWAFGARCPAVRVAAWGRLPNKRIHERTKGMAAWMRQCGALWCWGTTDDGEPRHPLMLPYATPLVSLVDGRPYP